MNDESWKNVKRPMGFFPDQESGYPTMDIHAGKDSLFVMSDAGLGYYVSVLNTGAVVIRSERSRQTVTYAIEDLVTRAIEDGLDEVKP